MSARAAWHETATAMSINPFMIELVLFSGAALAWGVYELWTVRDSKGDEPSSPADETRHPEG